MDQNAKFVDSERAVLIQRVSLVMQLADELRSKNMLSEEAYSSIAANKTHQDRMRTLYMFLDDGGSEVKSTFYTILKNYHPYLVQELENSATKK
ncbi:apoptosis-associated speck-like protein containing a CARD [Salminus brasiliensis]|uniref:apoptosis-associated speck-like protein containing a CARD n=1 Tax=Salminus brasiliensis TaxID=930266 RepID=UPI003B835A6B